MPLCQNRLFATILYCTHKKITLQSNKYPDIKQHIGSYLAIVKYKKNILLLPEKQEDNLKTFGFSYHYCFWKNLMENGLKLSNDAF